MSSKPSPIVIDTVRREVLLNERPLARHLTKTAGYLGLGALVHAWLLGPEFDQSSLWSWGYLIAWPVPMAFWFVVQALLFGLYAFALIVACSALWWTATGIMEGRERRRRAAARRATSGRDWLDPR